MRQQVERPIEARGTDARTYMYGSAVHLLYGHEVNVVQATHQQHKLVATRRWAKQSGTADATW